MQALREGFATVLTPKVRNAFQRDILAAVTVAALEVGVEQWRRESARRPLATYLKRAFGVLAELQ